MTLATCASLVENGDPDRFAATMTAPVAQRARLWPLYAFNLEIARAPYASSEPLVAEMRLQWWVDTAESISSGEPVTGDVAQSLARVIVDRQIPARLFSAMAEARRWEAWKDAFEDSAAFDKYIDATSGNLMWAAALALGVEPSAEPVVRDFAWGAGLASWFQAVPDMESHGRKPLIDGRPEAVRALANEGLVRIARARARRHVISRDATPALWPGFRARKILHQVVSSPASVANGGLGISDLGRSLALFGRALSGYW